MSVPSNSQLAPRLLAAPPTPSGLATCRDRLPVSDSARHGVRLLRPHEWRQRYVDGDRHQPLRPPCRPVLLGLLIEQRIDRPSDRLRGDRRNLRHQLKPWPQQPLDQLAHHLALPQRPFPPRIHLHPAERRELWLFYSEPEHRRQGVAHRARPVRGTPQRRHRRRQQFRGAGIQGGRQAIILIYEVFIRVNINRPSFMINSTNCSEFQTVSEGVGDQGTAVAFSSPFIAVNCEALNFTPKMTITQLGGASQPPAARSRGLNSTSAPPPATPTSNRYR